MNEIMNGENISEPFFMHNNYAKDAKTKTKKHTFPAQGLQ